MKFYVAAFVGEKERVRRIHHRLRELGHEITVDWTAHPGVFGKDREKYPERVRGIAIRDMNGVRDCDVFVLLSEPADGRAKYVELGAAIMSYLEKGKPMVYVLGQGTHLSVFFYHPAVKRVRTLDEVLADIKEGSDCRR